jgi:hypothetical protein
MGIPQHRKSKLRAPFEHCRIAGNIALTVLNLCLGQGESTDFSPRDRSEAPSSALYTGNVDYISTCEFVTQSRGTDCNSSVVKVDGIQAPSAVATTSSIG